MIERLEKLFLAPRRPLPAAAITAPLADVNRRAFPTGALAASTNTFTFHQLDLRQRVGRKVHDLSESENLSSNGRATA